MKIIINLLLILFVLSSCNRAAKETENVSLEDSIPSTNEDVENVMPNVNNAEKRAKFFFREYVSNNADDPSSYEAVETKIIKVYKNGKLKNIFLKSYLKEVDDAEARVADSTTTLNYKEYYQKEAERYSTFVNAAIAIPADSDKTYRVLLYHKYRIENRFGALVLGETYAVVDENYSTGKLFENERSAEFEIISSFRLLYLRLTYEDRTYTRKEEVNY